MKKFIAKIFMDIRHKRRDDSSKCPAHLKQKKEQRFMIKAGMEVSKESGASDLLLLVNKSKSWFDL